MKKMLLGFFAMSGLSAQLFAQAPTLTSDNTSPKPGDSYISQSAAVTGITLPAGGANQAWNYSNLTDSGEAIASQAVLPAATPFADSFPGSNLVLRTANDSVYAFFTSTSSALLENGIATYDSAIFRISPASTYMTYPFTYNSVFSSPVTQQLPGYELPFTGADTLTGDGYGSLILPGRTFNNVLRVRYTRNLGATVSSGVFVVSTNIRIVSYLYFSPGTHAPVLSDVYTTSTIVTTFAGNSIVSSTDSRDISYLKTFVLPVSFRSFTATLKNDEVAIQWSTAQEVNADHFTIQRSLTGRDFQDISSVKAAGHANGSDYSFLDKSFAGNRVPPAVFYRIQATDKDGKQTTSAIAVVHGDDAVVIRVSPNPASEYIRISSSDAVKADLVAIYDAKGSLVKQWRNVSTSEPLYLAELNRGAYVVKVMINGKTISTTIIKQ